MEEKIFELMAHAEDLQKHAVQLQDKAQETFSGLTLAVEQAQKKIRSTGLQMALIMLGVGVIVCGASAAFIGWSTSSLRDEAAELRSTIAALKRNVAEEQKTLRELSGKTWRLELVKWDDERGIILPKGVKFVRSGQIDDGREAIVIKP